MENREENKEDAPEQSARPKRSLFFNNAIEKVINN